MYKTIKTLIAIYAIAKILFDFHGGGGTKKSAYKWSI